MKKITVTLGQNTYEEGMNLNVTLKQFRDQLNQMGYTEVNTVYRAGKHIVTFLTGDMSRLQLIDSGLIKGTRMEKKEYKSKTNDVKTKINSFGYSW